MRKAVRTTVAASTILFGSLFLADSVHAETLQDVKDERAEVQGNLSEAESKIADVMVELEELNKKIETVNDAIAKNKQKMNETKEKITKTEEEVTVLEEEVKKLQEKIDQRKEVLKERIVSLQKNGGDISYLEVVFGSKSFGDMISRLSAVSKIAESDERLMKQQQADKAEVEEKKQSAEEKLEGLKDMKVELEGMKETYTEQKEQNKKDKQKLKEKKQDLNAMKAELENKDSSLAAVESQIEQRKNNETTGSNSSGNTAAAADSSSNSSSSNDGELKQLSKSTSNGGGNHGSAISAGYTQTGTPYVFGGKSTSGFDCSGFVSWAYGQSGVSLPSSTSAMQSAGSQISYSSAQPGDLVFFNTYKTNGHVGIYLGNGKFLGAQSSTGVAVADMTSGYWKDKFAGHVRRVN